MSFSQAKYASSIKKKLIASIPSCRFALSYVKQYPVSLEDLGSKIGGNIVDRHISPGL